jgi:hypothetical protein
MLGGLLGALNMMTSMRSRIGRGESVGIDTRRVFVLIFFVI